MPIGGAALALVCVMKSVPFFGHRADDIVTKSPPIRAPLSKRGRNIYHLSAFVKLGLTFLSS